MGHPVVHRNGVGSVVGLGFHFVKADISGYSMHFSSLKNWKDFKKRKTATPHLI